MEFDWITTDSIPNAHSKYVYVCLYNSCIKQSIAYRVCVCVCEWYASRPQSLPGRGKKKYRLQVKISLILLIQLISVYWFFFCVRIKCLFPLCLICTQVLRQRLQDLQPVQPPINNLYSRDNSLPHTSTFVFSLDATLRSTENCLSSDFVSFCVQKASATFSIQPCVCVCVCMWDGVREM